MLNTFDENLVITAVQQLTTDLNSMSARIKKLEEGGGGGGLELVDSLDITLNLKNDTTWDSITPSTSEVQIRAADSQTRMEVDSTLFDFSKEGLIVTAQTVINYKYKDNPELKLLPISLGFSGNYFVMNCPSSYDQLKTKNFVQYVRDMTLNSMYVYYNGSGTPTKFTNAFAAYPQGTTISFSSVNNKYQVKLSKIVCRCNASYFPVENFGYIDSENTNIIVQIRIYKAPLSICPILDTYYKLSDRMILPE